MIEKPQDPQRKRATFAANARKWKESRPLGEKNASRASKFYGGTNGKK